MPRARPQKIADWQTAAAEEEQGSGCFSAMFLPPLAVLLVGCLLAWFVSGLNILPQGEILDTFPATSLAENFASGLAPFFTPEVHYWSQAIVRWAADSGLEANLIAAVMQIESCGDPLARSHSGAMGLFQVMPYHFAADENPYDAETNARRGLNYLQRAWQAAGGEARLALAGYNGGIGVIGRSEAAWSAETRRYVYYGAAIYEHARQGWSSSPAMDEWFRKYGAGLCRQAHQHLGLP
ncbi:MAG: transglycosylase SLT domain-containing protein [Anaerolineae bacterium]